MRPSEDKRSSQLTACRRRTNKRKKRAEYFPMFHRNARGPSRVLGPKPFFAPRRRRSRDTRLRPYHLPALMALAAMVVAAGLSPLVAATGVAVRRTNQLLGLPGSGLHLPALDEASTIYAANGSVLARVHLDQNRQIVPLSAVNALTQRAVLDIEDHGFYQHGPLDVRAIVRALVADLEARTVAEGGSTFSQQ